MRLERLLSEKGIGGPLAELLSSATPENIVRNISLVKPGLPLLNAGIVSGLERLSDAELQSYGLFWKRSGESGNILSGHLEREAIRAYDVNQLIPEASPKVYALTKTAQGLYGYIMEFIDGYRLCDILRGKISSDGTVYFEYYDAKSGENKKNKINVDGLLKIRQELNCAVYALKSARVYHGDLWPPNVMIASVDLQVKLIDPWFEAMYYEIHKCVRNDYSSLELMNEELDAIINGDEKGAKKAVWA